MTMNDELKNIRMEVVVVYFKVLSQHIPVGAETTKDVSYDV
jgi:hypothetical protein